MQHVKWALRFLATLALLFGVVVPSRAQVSFNLRRAGTTFPVVALASNSADETALGGEKGELQVYNFRTKKSRKLNTNLAKPISGLYFGRSNDVFWLSAENFVQIWVQRSDGKWALKRQLEMLSDVCSIAISPDGKRFAVALEGNRAIEIRDTAKPQILRLSIGRSAGSTKIAFVGNQYLTELTAEGDARLYDAKTAALLNLWQAHPLNGLALAVKGSVLATSGDYLLPMPQPVPALDPLPFAIRFWDAKTGKGGGLIKLLAPATQLAFSSTGETLVSGGKDGFVRLYDTASGKEMSSYTDATRKPVRGLSLSPKGKPRLAIATGNLWVEFLTFQSIRIPTPR